MPDCYYIHGLPVGSTFTFTLFTHGLLRTIRSLVLPFAHARCTRLPCYTYRTVAVTFYVAFCRFAVAYTHTTRLYAHALPLRAVRLHCRSHTYLLYAPPTPFHHPLSPSFDFVLPAYGCRRWLPFTAVRFCVRHVVRTIAVHHWFYRFWLPHTRTRTRLLPVLLHCTRHLPPHTRFAHARVPVAAVTRLHGCRLHAFYVYTLHARYAFTTHRTFGCAFYHTARTHTFAFTVLPHHYRLPDYCTAHFAHTRGCGYAHGYGYAHGLRLRRFCGSAPHRYTATLRLVPVTLPHHPRYVTRLPLQVCYVTHGSGSGFTGLFTVTGSHTLPLPATLRFCGLPFCGSSGYHSSLPTVLHYYRALPRMPDFGSRSLYAHRYVYTRFTCHAHGYVYVHGSFTQFTVPLHVRRYGSGSVRFACLPPPVVPAYHRSWITLPLLYLLYGCGYVRCRIPAVHATLPATVAARYLCGWLPHIPFAFGSTLRLRIYRLPYCGLLHHTFPV